MTFLRGIQADISEGCRVLTRGRAEYLDSSEERVFAIVESASNITSSSDELHHSAVTWGERYHLSKSRANLLRSFQLDGSSTVLEVGAGCGAITRYLGEVAGQVDALEPVLERAKIARSRARDLDNVEVFVGDLNDVPVSPQYDAVVVVGVLEYAGAGSSDTAPYQRFLSAIREVLRPKGHLILAIENKLGVKYLAGAPEDHTLRVFDGVESYPRGTKARTFSKHELQELFNRTGFATTFLHAFPDYKLPRAMLSEGLIKDQSDLCWKILDFPSPDWDAARPSLAEERLLWRTLVEAGIGEHFSNSFVVVGTRDSTMPLWDEDVLAAFYNTERRSIFSTETKVRRAGGAIQFDRVRLHEARDTVEEMGLIHQVVSEKEAHGEELVEILSLYPDSSSWWLRQWKSLLEAAIPGESGSPIDLVPRNLIASADGTLYPIDQAWRHRKYTVDQILSRGSIGLAVELSGRVPAELLGVKRVIDLAARIGSQVGLRADGAWITEVLGTEAELDSQVRWGAPGSVGWESEVARRREGLEKMLARELEDGPLGMKEHELRARAERTLEEALMRWEKLEARRPIRLYRKFQRIFGRDREIR